MTNYDKIKKMTIDEMGEFLDDVEIESMACEECLDCEECKNEHCRLVERILWLRLKVRE